MSLALSRRRPHRALKPACQTVLCALLLSSAVHAETIYMSTGKNGRLVFTNDPAAAGEGVKMDTWPVGVALEAGATRAPIDLPPLRAVTGWRSPRTSSVVRVANDGIERLAADIAGRWGVDASLVHAVIEVESGFNARAVSSAGAQGLMQLMPQTARRFGVKSAFDPGDNIEGGVQYLRWLLTLFAGDVKLAIAAYNAGEGAVIRSGGRVPRLAETQRYVPAVMAAWERRLRQRAALTSEKRAALPAGGRYVSPDGVPP